jgi:hypothetical protein
VRACPSRSRSMCHRSPKSLKGHAAGPSLGGFADPPFSGGIETRGPGTSGNFAREHFPTRAGCRSHPATYIAGSRAAKSHCPNPDGRRGSELPVPRRRTFATGILPVALSLMAALSASCLRLPSRPALGARAAPHGLINQQPLKKGSRRAGSGPSSRPRAADGSMGRTPPATDWERT